MTAEAVAIDIPFERSHEDQAWARWLARSVDALLITPFVFVAFAVLGVLVELGRAPPVLMEWAQQPILSSVMELAVFFAIFALWEPLFISNTGTTPGKWIMGIRVKRENGARLTFLRALDRFVRLWFIGMGAGVPLLTLVLMLIARSRLVSEGQAAWDEQLGCVIEHRKRHPALWGLVLVLVVAITIGLRVLGRLSSEL